MTSARSYVVFVEVAYTTRIVVEATSPESAGEAAREEAMFDENIDRDTIEAIRVHPECFHCGAALVGRRKGRYLDEHGSDECDTPDGKDGHRLGANHPKRAPLTTEVAS